MKILDIESLGEYFIVLAALVAWVAAFPGESLASSTELITCKQKYGWHGPSNTLQKKGAVIASGPKGSAFTCNSKVRHGHREANAGYRARAVYLGYPTNWALEDASYTAYWNNTTQEATVTFYKLSQKTGGVAYAGGELDH